MSRKAVAEIPLGNVATDWLRSLAAATGSHAIGELDGRTILGERATINRLRVPALRSAGGGCRLYATSDGHVALNLSRPDDYDLLPALFGTEMGDPRDKALIETLFGLGSVDHLVMQGRLLGLAIAGVKDPCPPPAPVTILTEGPPRNTDNARAPRVLDLSALWAGPLAAHLLWLAGADVIKLESARRPDRMRDGSPTHFRLLNQGKKSVALDLRDEDQKAALLRLVAASDIVIEAARPRALAQLGIHADELVRSQPGLIWVNITGHGAQTAAAGWVAFGDDAAVAGGLSAALADAAGTPGFVGDAIADPLTGITAARTAWEAWQAGTGARYGIAMSGVVASALSEARRTDEMALNGSLKAWAGAKGQPFPRVSRSPIGDVSAFGADTADILGTMAPC